MPDGAGRERAIIMIRSKGLSRKLFALICLIGFGWCVQSQATGQEEQSEGTTRPSIETYMKMYDLKNALQLMELKIDQNDEQLHVYDTIGYEEKRTNLGKRPILKSSQWDTPFRRKTTFVIRLDRQLPLKLTFKLLHVAGNEKQNVQKLSYFIKQTEMDEQFLTSDRTGRFTLDLRSITQAQSILFRLRQDQEIHDIEFVLFDIKRPVSLE